MIRACSVDVVFPDINRAGADLRLCKSAPIAYCYVTLYNILMIRSFKHKGLEQFFYQGSKKGMQPKHATKLRIQLAALDNAKDVADVAVPNWRLHALSGDLKGHFSISVDENWRLTFRFEKGDVEVLDYQDYH